MKNAPNFTAKLYVKAFRLGLFLSTLCARLRYWHLIDAGRRCRIGWGLEIKPIWKRGAASLTKLVLADQVMLGSNIVLKGGSRMIIGERSYCGSFCVFGTNDGITVGKDVMISDFVGIRDTDHSFSDCALPMNKQGIRSAAITIEDNAWIGHGATILKGVTVGKGAIVGAGAVVTGDVPPMSIVAGVPAKVIRYRAETSGSANLMEQV